MKKTLVVLFCIFILKNSFAQILSHGTSIIIAATKDSIWIAADSKVISQSVNNIDDIISSNNKCKIFNYSGIEYAISGTAIITNENGDTIFNADKELLASLKCTNNIFAAAADFNKKTFQSLKFVYQHLFKKMNKSSLDKWFSGNQSAILGYSLNSFSSTGHPNSTNISFQLNGDKNKWEIDTLDGGKLTDFTIINTMIFSFLGFTEIIPSLLNSNPSFFNTGTIKDKLTELIRLEIKAHPTFVGEPISIKALYVGGQKWLTHDDICP